MATAVSVGKRLGVAATGLRVSTGWVCLAAVVVVVCLRLGGDFGTLLTSLGDTDDATRLVQLGAFLEHGRWWDLTLERIGAPEPLVSHWSRLVDLGLVSIFRASNAVLGAEQAQLAMRILWPSLMLLGLLGLVARDAERDAGLIASVVVAVLTVRSSTALYQFQAGRIDHHNVQILCGVGGMLLLARSLVTPSSGWLAGVLIGVGLTVGLESATLVGPMLVVAVLIGLARRDGLEGPMRLVAAMTATLMVGVFVSLGPMRLAHLACDSLSLNLVMLVGFGTAGVIGAALAARRLDGWRRIAVQIASLGVGGTAGLSIYGLLEPRCLAGPFGQVSGELWSVWLSHVTEGKPIGYLYAQSPAGTLGFVSMVFLGMAARIWLALTDRVAHGEQATLYRHMVLLAAQILAFVAACWQVKMMPYAAWLALPALAVAIASLPGTKAVGAPVVRLFAVFLVWQTTLGTIAGAVLSLASGPVAAKEPPARTSCSETPTISALAGLPPGLVLADINLGPYVAALTPHRVAMAPYHRLDRSIVEAHALLGAAPETAETGLRRLGVDYVVACRTSDAVMPSGGAPAAGMNESLATAVASGRGASYLASVPLPSAPHLGVYRVLPARN